MVCCLLLLCLFCMWFIVYVWTILTCALSEHGVVVCKVIMFY